MVPETMSLRKVRLWKRHSHIVSFLKAGDPCARGISSFQGVLFFCKLRVAG